MNEQASAGAARGPAFSRIARVLGLGAVALLGGVVVVTLVATRDYLRTAARYGRDRSAQELAAFDDAFAADRALVASLPLFSRGTSADAANYLNARLSWAPRTGGEPAAATAPLSLPAEVGAKLAGSLDYASSDVDLDKYDTRWMADLLAFDHWSIDVASPLAEMEPYDLFDGSMPDFTELLRWAKLRLLTAYRNGGVDGASAEVQHMARLCFSTETLVGEMIGLAILANERSFRAALVARGDTSLPSGAALSEGDAARVRRAAFASFSYASPTIPDPYWGRLDGSSPIDCAAIHETLVYLLIHRSVAADAKRAWYARANQLLASPCRMTALRRAWRAEQAPVPLLASCDRSDATPTLLDYCAKMRIAVYFPPFRELALDALEGGPQDGYSGFAGYR